MGELIYRLITAAILIGFIAHRGYYTRKMRHAPNEVIKKLELGWGERIANILAIPALLSTIIYIINPDWMAWAALSLQDWLRWLGVAIALAGFGLLEWAQLALGKNWSDAPKLLESQAMVVNGPYHHIRHPIYAAFLWILGSLLLITANWFIGAAWIAMTGLDVAARMKAEEARMVGQFGEPYQEYKRRTGRILPRIR
jgi:protein-S-isoprenylcysteine O-methyltransferase Ste14